MNFLDVKTDYAFKKVFATEENKPLLIDFLNSIIDFKDDAKIEDLTIIDPYNIPMLKGMKDTFVDVKARLDNNTKVIIEMQVLNNEGFEKRVLYNAAKNYSIQLNKAEDYHLLNPVIALSIVNFEMFKDSQKVVTHFKLLEKSEFIDYSDDIELIFVELPKFKKQLEELETIQDQWIYFIKNAGSLEFVPKDLDNSIQQALQTVNEANLTKDELEMQHKRKDFIAVQRLAVLKATKDGHKQGVREGKEEGLKEGIEQGIEKGREDERKQLIVNAYRNGMPTNLIGNFVGMDEEEIITILKSVDNL